MKSVQKTVRTAAAGTTLILATGAAAQDGALAGVNELGTLEYETINPQDLPGRKKGDRTPEEEAIAEPAEEASKEWFDGDDWWTWSRGTGNWNGLRTKMEDAGLTLESAFVLDWMSVQSGGVNDTSESIYLFDMNIALDTATAFDMPGGTVFLDFYTMSEDSISANSGDFQGVSNIETGEEITEIAELWYEQWIKGNVRLKVGKVDANSEFAFVDAAGEFIGASAGVSPTIGGLPTYPDPAMSINVFAYPTETIYFGAAIYDGAAQDGVNTGRRGPATFFNDDKSDAYFFIGEAGFTWDRNETLGAGRAAIGAWSHTGTFDNFDGSTDDGTQGFFALAEAQVWAEDPQDDENEQGVSVFVQYGWADEDVSEAAQHFGIGASAIGLIPNRDDDAAGIYISRVDLSDAAPAGFDDDETSVELFYKFQVTPFFSVKPDMQFFFNPSGDSTVDDTVVAGLRAEFTF